MKVWLDADGCKRLIGRADIEDTGQVVHEEALFGAASTIVERFALGAVTSFDANGRPVVHRGVIIAPGQRPELLPGWQRLDG